MNPKTFRTLRLFLPALLLVFLLPAPDAHAARDENPWMIGLDFLANHAGDEDDYQDFSIDEKGGGAALQFGYRFTPRFLLRLYLSGAKHETDYADVDVTFSGGLIEAMYLFRPDEAFRPYLFGGVGGFKAEAKEEVFTYSTEGPGASFGAGLYYWFTPHVSLHSSVRLEAVNWDKTTYSIDTGIATIEAEVPVDDEGSAAKFTLGMAFWF